MNLPNPTKDMRCTPEFEAIWQCIKSWDINVPDAYRGYCGATGSHVAAILEAIQNAGLMCVQTISMDAASVVSPEFWEAYWRRPNLSKEDLDAMESVSRQTKLIIAKVNAISTVPPAQPTSGS